MSIELHFLELHKKYLGNKQNLIFLKIPFISKEIDCILDGVKR